MVVYLFLPSEEAVLYFLLSSAMVLIGTCINHFQLFEQFPQNAPIKSMNTTFRTALTLQSRTKHSSLG
jgi:hypothetical protein